MVLYDVLDVLHPDDGDLQLVFLLFGLRGALGVRLAETAGAGPELGASNLLTGQRPDVVSRHPETTTAESEVWGEHLHLAVLPQLGDDASEPIVTELEDQELSNAEIIRGHRNLLSLLSHVLEINLHRNV